LPPEVLAPLVEAAFIAHGGPELVILGGNAERVFARKLSRLFRPAVLQKVDNACGRTSLSDLPDILAGCDLVLTPDTGIMHLAAHMGIPVQAFFLSSAWCFETGPYGDGHVAFQATRPCAPCVETRSCPYAVACLSPFTAAGLRFSVQGKEPEAWLNDLARFRTHCDAFGCDYLPEKGELPELANRAALRSLVAEFCGSGDAGTAASRFAETVFHETDWMLPPTDASGRAGILPQGE
jgi:hypothetical protein